MVLLGSQNVKRHDPILIDLTRGGGRADEEVIHIGRGRIPLRGRGGREIDSIHAGFRVRVPVDELVTVQEQVTNIDPVGVVDLVERPGRRGVLPQRRSHARYRLDLAAGPHAR